jgi:hypothetical protein
MMADENLLTSLNSSPLYDHSKTLNATLHTNDDTGTFLHINLSSNFHDINSFIQSHADANNPIILSLNVQSLQSKFNSLLELINNFSRNKVKIDVIALQETWSIPHPDLFTIPGYHPIITKHRTGGRGGVLVSI